MKEFLASLIAWGSPGLFIAALLDGAGLPIPGGVDVLVMYLASQSPERAIWLAVIAVLGSVIGNFILFLIARRGGQAFLEKRSSSKRSRKFRQWFDTYGLTTVFVSALVPLPVMPMKIFVLSAGALGSQPLRFLGVFLSARIPRYIGLALLGRAMGNNAMAYLTSHVWHLVGFAVALFAVLAFIIHYADTRTASSPASSR
ncbi:MAG TPA: VTT domain-containing protein [Bryobacteraceae bacterium]|nr:VTT domain-containing protein [Bryobacteraceae bacterium]